MTDRVIRVVVDSRGVTTGARRAKGELDKLDRQSKGLTTGFKAAAGAVAAFAGALAVREVFRAVDAYQGLQNRLRIVTDSSEELASVQKELFEISQNTRTSFEATARLFGSAAIAADELGASTEQLLRLTEISGKALAIQGSSANESRGALRQLSQAFSSGIVRAEEFNSILEGAFPIAQAAARGFGEAGVSVGKLRQLVIEGKVSSTEFFDAILKGGEGIDEQFEKTEVTLSQANTNIANSFLNLVGKINETSGAGKGLADIMVGVSDAIDDLALALTGTLQPQDEISAGMQLFASTVIVAGFALSAFAESIITTVVTAFSILGETIGATAAGLVAFASLDFDAAIQIFGELGENVANEFAEGFGGFGRRLEEDTATAINRLEELWVVGSRDIIDAATGGGDGGRERPILPPNSVEDIQDARDAIADFQAALIQGTAELRLTRDAGEDAAQAIREYRENLELANATTEIFGELNASETVDELREAFVQYGEEALAAQRALREEIETADLKETFDEQIEALEEEIMLLGASNEMLAINAEARALAGGATADQAEQIRRLTEALLDEQDQLSEAANSVQDFLDDVAGAAENTLSGILADPMADGLDELPFKFAQTLQALAAEALASELFEILAGLGGGGQGGGIASFFGGLFGAAEHGGQVTGGQPILVGERGPEIFSPPGSGGITPNVNINQAAQAAPTIIIQNVTDPADIPAGLATAEGEEAIINIIQRNPDAIRKLLG